MTVIRKFVCVVIDVALFTMYTDVLGPFAVAVIVSVYVPTKLPSYVSTLI